VVEAVGHDVVVDLFGDVVVVAVMVVEDKWFGFRKNQHVIM